MYGIIGGAIIFIACVYLGTAADRVYKKRYEILTELPLFIDFCDGEIAFYKLPVQEIFNKFLERYPKSLVSEAMSATDDSTVFAKAKLIINETAQGISALDRQSHKAFFTVQRNNITIETAKALKDSEIRGKLFKRLAPLLGLGLFILIM